MSITPPDKAKAWFDNMGQLLGIIFVLGGVALLVRAGALWLKYGGKGWDDVTIRDLWDESSPWSGLNQILQRLLDAPMSGVLLVVGYLVFQMSKPET